MQPTIPKTSKAWRWIPTLYFAEGLPYVVVMTVSVIMYKRLGISNAEIALYTSWLYLPWVIKPLWSPVVDLLKTKRYWIVLMQLFIGAGFAGVALTIPVSAFFQWTLVVSWLMAFSSATHDIAADGFYILALSERDQSFFVGIRSTFYRIAMIAGQGLLVMLAGYLEGERLLGAEPSVPLAWSATFLVLAGLFLLLSLYHRRALPFPSNDHGATEGRSRGFMAEFIATFLTFVRKKKFGYAVAFLLLYRFAESQLVKLASPFMLDPREVGGLGLATAEVGFIYGTVGVLALTLGGILGGVAAAKQGLKYWLWWMALAINIPNLLYLFLSYAQPESLFIVSACVALEQFGYGFGFAAYMLYMIYLSQGDHATAHYALCTGFMALGMMLPGMASGWIQELLGYQTFFLWISLATIPSFIVTALIHLEPEYGRKADQPS